MDRFALKNGDRVLFYGDSITEHGYYANFVEAFARTRFPERDIRFFNAAWSGDATWGGAGGAPTDRVRRDIQPFHPTAISVMLGMNDGGYVPFDSRIYGIFREWYGKLLDNLHQAAPHARLTLIETSPYDDFTRKPESFAGYNATLIRFGEAVREIAAKRHAGFVDFNAPMVSLLKKASVRNPRVAEKLVPDFIHPAPAGHLLMAAVLLRAWNAPPVVTTVRLDAAQKRVTEATNTEIRDFNGRAWSAKDRSLPFAADFADATMALTLQCSEVIALLNQQKLTVTGLTRGVYRLTIDGASVGTFPSRDLAQGIDLAFRDTPMHRQGRRVLATIEHKNRTAFLRWREFQIVGQASPGRTAAIHGLERFESELREAARVGSQPKPRRYVLTPV